MNIYLIIPECGISPDDFYIVESPTLNEAKYIAVKNLYKNDELFIDHIKQCTINMSFAEKFWLQTDEEHMHFNTRGKILIDYNEFQTRVKKYFGENIKAAEDYIAYYSLACDEKDEEANEAFKNFINNAENFLIQEYLEYTNYQVLDIAKIKKI